MTGKIRKFFLPLVLLIGLLLRVVLLSEVPPGLANDEANIILNAQSILHTGKNIPGVVTGIFGTQSGNFGGGVHSELSSYILAVFYAIIGFSISTVRMPFAVASLGVAIFIYLISKKLFGERVANVALVLSALNPWLIHFGRSGYESILSAFFYLAAIYLYLVTKGWKIFFVVPFLLAGFFCYFSAKVLLLPLALTFIVLEFLLKKKKSLRQVVILNVLIVLFLVFYSQNLMETPAGSRLFELQSSTTAVRVDDARTHSINFPLERLVENKAVEELESRLAATLPGASVNFLFLDWMPEPSGHLSIPDQGPLYLIELAFLVAGAVFLARSQPKKLIVLTSIALITFLPNFLDIKNSTYSMRPVILVPILLIISSFGIYSVYKSLSNKNFKTIFIVTTLIIYAFSFTRFVYQYYFRMPIENNDSWFFEDRIATRYIKSLTARDPSQNIFWITPLVHHTFYRYIFFAGLYNDEQSIEKVNNLLEKQNYSLDRLTVESECPKEFDQNIFYIVEPTLKCKLPPVSAEIKNIDDAGTKYFLINDPLCKGKEHKSYPLIKDYRLLSVERLADEEFCMNYISQSQK